MSIELLPREILQKIFGYCHNQTAISQVCHRWNDAVQYLLVPRMHLTVAHVTSTHEGEDDDDDNESFYSYTTELISKDVLLASSRKYTRFKVELYNGETDEIQRTLKGMLDVCKRRYEIQQLYLRGSPNKTLVQLFKHYNGWLQTLTSLDVLLYEAEPSRARVGGLVTLPNLERLYWYEGDQDYGRGRTTLRTDRGGNAFGLNAPKLSFLVIDLDCDKERNLLKSRRQDPEVCRLFLPTLELKTASDFRRLRLRGVLNMNQCYIDGSQRILANLEYLTLNSCHSDVVVRICDKCPNLKELTIYNQLRGSMPLQVSSALSANLQKLTIMNSSSDVSFVLYGPAVFPKLQYLYLYRIHSGMRQTVSLDAPQLTSIDLNETFFRQSILTHNTTQLRTMGLKVQKWNDEELHPLPSVTQLGLYTSHYCTCEDRLIEKYLEGVPHLTRLKLAFATNRYSEPQLTAIDLAFVETLPKLEHLTIHRIAFRLAECAKLTGLKSFVLSECSIKSEPSDGTVVLTALEYVRVDSITIEGIQYDSFPMQVNERQPPIEITKVSAKGMNVFSSKNFRPTYDNLESF